MPGGGSIQGMITQYRQNMSLLRRTKLFKKKRPFRSINPEDINIPKTETKTKKATKEQLEIIKKQIIKQGRKDRFFQIVIFAGSIILFSFIAYQVYSIISTSNSNEILKKEQLRKRQDQEKNETYINLIVAGDKNLKENKWNNAILYYNEASELFPNGYESKYRLALAMTYRCQHKKVNCKKTKTLIDSLIKDFPKKSELYELRASYYYIFGDSIKAELDYKTIDKLFD
jgi:predicted Zn-dependent protease